MPPVTATADIGRSAEDVFAYATDPGRFREWQKGVLEAHMDEPGATRVGARCVTTRRIGLASRAAVAEITHADPPRTWSVTGIDGPIRAKVDLTVQALGPSRARLTIAVDFTGHGIGRLLVPLIVRSQARHEMPGNLAALKQRLEQPPPGN